MSPSKDRALQAALARFARICRLRGHFNDLPTEELHVTTENIAFKEALYMNAQGLPSRHITNTLNTVCHAYLS